MKHNCSLMEQSACFKISPPNPQGHSKSMRDAQTVYKGFAARCIAFWKKILFSIISGSLICYPHVLADAPQLFEKKQQNFALSTQDIELNNQRNLFSEALILIEMNEWGKLRSISQQLSTYPLYPYLVYSDLVTNFSIPKRGQVSDYLDKYSGTVMANRLRSRWLSFLAKRGQWTNYQKYYQLETASTARKCQFHYAQYLSLIHI